MKSSQVLALLLAGVALTAQAQAPAAAPQPAAAAPTPAAEPLYATVNGTPITQRDFLAAYASHVRTQFYHREGIAEERLQAARQEVGDKLIERILLLEEARRRQIAADDQQVNDAIAGYEKRYAASPMWQQNKDKMVPGLRERLAEQSRLERLEQSVRNLPTPTAAEARAFYEANPQLFTEPEKLHLHTILLKVDPSAPATAWDAAREEGTRIVKQLRGGADFGELARIHSQDKSAAEGGDMGYLHLGMLPEPLQARIDKIAVGEVGDPIDVLEGIGVFRLDERVSARHRKFEEVAERAGDLLQRNRQKDAWTAFVAGLRRGADVRLTESPAQAR